ncbi:hypothetical protein [Peptostreptococcus anaerobius]|uniref:hypothetical protein n=1 Tax=Peptostreptococcus anaerobius TaxID=1261 RepID=UPI0024308A5F|nr:hypothetical protein [Peptostreptococcus anaerobius]
MDDILKIKFEGENDISIDDLAIFLKYTSKFLNNLRGNLDMDKSVTLNTKIVAFEKGSFTIDISPILEFVCCSAPLIPTIISSTKEFIDVVMFVIESKKFLKGKEYREMYGNTIINHYGNSITVNDSTINIYSGNNGIFESLDKMINSAPQDRAIEISSHNCNDIKKVRILPEDRIYFKNKKDNEYRISYSRITLTVKKPDLEMKSKWLVWYDKQIMVDILDVDFADKVRNGEVNFVNGTLMDVVLQIKAPIKDDGSVKPEYNIIKVHKIWH